MLKLSDLKQCGHLPTLISAFLYFDFSLMVWTLLGPLGAQVGETLHLSPDQKGLMVAVPILSGAFLRILLGLLVDRIGPKRTGLIAQIIVICGLLSAWLAGLPSLTATISLGLVLGFAGASFAVALPQAGRWYPPNMQGVVMGIAGAGNMGVVLDSLFAPRLAQTYGWQAVFGLALIPAVLVLLIYLFCQGTAELWPEEAIIGLPQAVKNNGRALVLLLLHRELWRLRGLGQQLRDLL